MTETVGVMGLGLMGAAIAHRLVAVDAPVVVWNRTRSKADPHAAAGAMVAASPQVLLEAVDIVVAVTATTTELLAFVEASGDRLKGKDFINLVTGSPAQIRGLEAAVLRQGAAFLSGAIQCYPGGIGTADAVIIFAGDPEVWTRREGLIKALAGSAYNAGRDPGVPNLLDASVTACFFFGAMACCLEGAHLVQKEGVDLKQYRQFLTHALELLPRALDGMLDALEAEDFATDQATLEIFARSQALFRSSYTDIGASDDMMHALTRKMQAAVDAGDGQLGFPALYQHRVR